MKLNLDNKWVLIILNLIVMALILWGLCWITLSWLNVWTGHGDNVVVPDVRGMSDVQAGERLVSDGFIMEISDSIYDTKHRPGEVVEQNPRRNTLVKPGRVVYVTINAKTPKMVTVPRLTDISSRQAHAILEGLGIKNVSEVPVISECKDLVIEATANGRPLVAGARIPITSSISLHVGTGMDEFNDSTDVSTEPADFERLNLF